MSLSQVLQCLLEVKLIVLRDPPRNPNTAFPGYNPNARCAYHSNSPGHDTNSCWTLRNKIQDLIEEGTLEFAPDGQLEFFCRPSKALHLKWQVQTKRLLFIWIFNCNFFCYSNNYLLMSNSVSLMHCICLSWIHLFVFTIFKLCFYSSYDTNL